MIREFSVWGAAARLGLSDGRVKVAEGDDVVARVVARLERDSGRKAWHPKAEGTALDSAGNPEAYHYHVTLGRPTRYGGLNVDGEVWFSIPLNR